MSAFFLRGKAHTHFVFLLNTQNPAHAPSPDLFPLASAMPLGQECPEAGGGHLLDSSVPDPKAFPSSKVGLWYLGVREGLQKLRSSILI